MVRTQIQITERQAQKLHTVASRQGISIAEVIRRAIDAALAHEVIPDQEEIRRRARAAVGKFADTATDVSVQHDRYLTEAFGE